DLAALPVHVGRAAVRPAVGVPGPRRGGDHGRGGMVVDLPRRDVAGDQADRRAARPAHDDLVDPPVRAHLAHDQGRTRGGDGDHRHRPLLPGLPVAAARHRRRDRDGRRPHLPHGHRGQSGGGTGGRAEAVMNRSTTAGLVLRILGILVALGIAVFPLYWMLVTALSTNAELFAPRARLFPDLGRLGVFGEALADGKALGWLVNSLTVATGTMVVSIGLGIPLGYALSRFTFRGK